MRTQLIAHDKEVFDISFSRGNKDLFASVGRCIFFPNSISFYYLYSLIRASCYNFPWILCRSVNSISNFRFFIFHIFRGGWLCSSIRPSPSGALDDHLRGRRPHSSVATLLESKRQQLFGYFCYG